MNADSRIYVAGHTGMVGSAVVRCLQAHGYTDVFGYTHAELDLTRQMSVERMFASRRPEYVFLAAARVGGIQANLESPADFSYDNLAIAANVIHSAQHFGTRRLLYFSSSCVYPRDCRQPMHETDLWSGAPEPSSEPYATAKLAGMSLCRAISVQYGAEFFAVIPPNLYGPGDNYDPERSHVMAALIRKFHEAKVNDAPEVVLWGTGEPRRDMMYVDDVAEAAVLLMERYAGPEPVNVGTGEDRPIAHLAGIVAGIVGYTGRVTFDAGKPNGTMRKLMDVSRLAELGYTCNRSLTDGIRLAYDDYLKDAQS